MKVEHYHHGWFCGDTGFADQDYTPEQVLKNYTDRRNNENGWYDVMWGSQHYIVKEVHWADNETKVVVKLKRVY